MGCGEGEKEKKLLESGTRGEEEEEEARAKCVNAQTKGDPLPAYLSDTLAAHAPRTA